MNTHSQVSSAPNAFGDAKRRGRVIIGIVALLASAGYLYMALNMPMGDLSTPGPGAFPAGVGTLAVAISMIVIVEALLGRSESGEVTWPKGHELKQCAIFLGTLVAFIVLLPLLGQYVTSTLYVAAFLKFSGRLSWIRSIIFGLIIGAGSTYIFSELLDISLPKGFW